jgi:hypothetical protein
MGTGLCSTNARVSNHVYKLRLLRENLIGDDNHEIKVT